MIKIQDIEAPRLRSLHLTRFFAIEIKDIRKEAF
jgi:hypothetical protein